MARDYVVVSVCGAVASVVLTAILIVIWMGVLSFG